MEYPFNRTDVNLTVLRDALSEALHRPVELLAIPAQSYDQEIMEDITVPVYTTELVETQSPDGESILVPRVRDTGQTKVIGKTPTRRTERIMLQGTLKVLDPETGNPIDVDELIVESTISACPASIAIPEVGVIAPLSNNEIEQLRALISN